MTTILSRLFGRARVPSKCPPEVEAQIDDALGFVPITIRVSKATHAVLASRARDRGTPLTAMVREALTNWAAVKASPAKNTIYHEAFDAEGHRVSYGWRGTADARRDTRIMDVAVEFFYARKRGVNITPADLWEHVMGHEPEPQVCDRPPVGWECSRPKGHEGPCAATLVIAAVPGARVAPVPAQCNRCTNSPCEWSGTPALEDTCRACGVQFPGWGG